MAGMGKWKGKYDSGRKYNTSWEEKFLWLTKASDGTEHAFCKLCKVQLAPKLSRIAEHEKTKGHESRVAASSHCRALPFAVVSKGNSNRDLETTKRTEIELAATIACHCSTSTVDHLGEFMRKNGKGSNLAKLQVHHTKCSKVQEKKEVALQCGNTLHLR